jgi:hypothetical protein
VRISRNPAVPQVGDVRPLFESSIISSKRETAYSFSNWLSATGRVLDQRATLFRHCSKAAQQGRVSVQECRVLGLPEGYLRCLRTEELVIGSVLLVWNVLLKWTM